jgi:N-acyl-D-amino-acid deacylase
MIDEARSGDLDVTCDQYPYLAGATGLTIILPKWALDGGGSRLLERLKSEDTRAKIALELKKAAEHGGWIANDNGWESVVVSGVATEANKRFEGMNLLQISQVRGEDPVDTVINLLTEEELRVGVILFSQCEEDMQTVMQHPTTMIGTDATARALSGPMSQGKPHPRSFGTFPRVLGRYVRELGLLSLEQAVAKMTSLPTAKLGIINRGVIEPGAWADITMFDPQTIIDTATYKDPHQIASGIKYVIVNGEVAVEDGHLTGALAGKVLRKSTANRLRR